MQLVFAAIAIILIKQAFLDVATKGVRIAQTHYNDKKLGSAVYKRIVSTTLYMIKKKGSAVYKPKSLHETLLCLIS